MRPRICVLHWGSIGSTGILDRAAGLQIAGFTACRPCIAMGAEGRQGRASANGQRRTPDQRIEFRRASKAHPWDAMIG